MLEWEREGENVLIWSSDSFRASLLRISHSTIFQFATVPFRQTAIPISRRSHLFRLSCSRKVVEDVWKGGSEEAGVYGGCRLGSRIVRIELAGEGEAQRWTSPPRRQHGEMWIVQRLRPGEFFLSHLHFTLIESGNLLEPFCILSRACLVAKKASGIFRYYRTLLRCYLFAAASSSKEKCHLFDRNHFTNIKNLLSTTTASFYCQMFSFAYKRFPLIIFFRWRGLSLRPVATNLHKSIWRDIKLAAIRPSSPESLEQYYLEGTNWKSLSCVITSVTRLGDL